MKALVQIPLFLLNLLQPLLTLLTGIPAAKVSFFKKSVQVWEGLNQRDLLKNAYISLMEEAGVEVLISPAQLIPAPPTGTVGRLLSKL